MVVTSKLNDFTVSWRAVKYCKQSDEGGADAESQGIWETLMFHFLPNVDPVSKLHKWKSGRGTRYNKPEILKHPYSILTGETMVGFVIYVHSVNRRCSASQIRAYH